MNNILKIIFVTIIFTMSGCAVNVTKGEAFPEIYAENPVSILVIPAINNSTAADAPLLYSSTINEPLSNAGFYVLPIEITDRFLRNEGMAEGHQLIDVPPEKFAESFGADAVLYVTIDKWDTNYYVIGGNVTVAVRFQMKSCKTGATLWTYSDQLRVDTSGDANSGGGLLGAIIATAIATATQDYVPVARKINVLSLNSIPFGKYHNLHNQDMGMTVNQGKLK